MIHRKRKGKNSPAGVPENKVRIVGGMWKRTPLVVADVAGLRPTSERVRETLFNWLMHLRGNNFGKMHSLDMFAGTGALGFEAASRGVAHVTMIEENETACTQLQVVRKRLDAAQVSIYCADALRLAGQFARTGRKFDLIFLDPPFQKDLLPHVLPLCVRLLANNGLVYMESGEFVSNEKLESWIKDDTSGLQIIREGQAGQVYYHLLEMKASSPS